MPRDSAESPTDFITRMTFGYRNTQALYVVAKLGVPDLLAAGPDDCQTMAKKLGVRPDPLYRVMRALAAQGVFTQDSSDRFGLTEVSQLLRTDVPDSMRYIAISMGEEQYRAAGELLLTVKTGEVAFDHIYGKGHFDYLAEHEDASRTFNMFMAQGVRRMGDPLAGYDLGGRSLVVDVGGGRGTLVAKVLRAHPSMKGILFDLPQGASQAPEFLRKEGVSDRCKVVTGSFFESVPAGGDLYLLSRILHDWPDEKAVNILKNCRRAMRDDSVLVIVDAVVPPGDAPSMAKQRDLTMLFMLGGKERSEREWESLLAEAGFKLSRVINAGPSFDLVEAVPA